MSLNESGKGCRDSGSKQVAGIKKLAQESEAQVEVTKDIVAKQKG